jgi:hypothetical protein
MEIAALTAFISPFLPFLLKLGGKAAEKATESAAGKFGEASWAKAQAVWDKLSPKIEAKESAKEAAIDVANAPEDEDLQVALKVQLKKLLAEDEALVRAIGLEINAGKNQYQISMTQNNYDNANGIQANVEGGTAYIGEIHISNQGL